MRKLLILTVVFCLVSIQFVLSIAITTPSELYTDDTYRIFEFSIVNNNSVILKNVSWSFDTKDNTIIDSNKNIILAVDGQNISVYLEYNYSTRGTFNIEVNASNGTLVDSESYQVVISDLVVIDFSYIYLDEREFVFEFVINNTDDAPINDINWSLSMDNGYVINSSYLFNLSSKETIHLFINYNYTASGNYDVVARAYDSTNDHSLTLSIKTNTSPVISPLLPDVTFKEDEYNDTINLDGYVTDEDYDADLTWTATGNSSETVMVEILSDNTINFTAAQDYWTNGVNITFIVTDTDSLSENDTIIVIVGMKNDAPVITWHTPANNITQLVPANSQLQFNHTSTDIDEDVLTYNWTLDNVQQAITQAWLYQPTTADEGDHIVNLTVSDGLATASLQWDVTVYITYCNNQYNITMPVWNVTSDVTCENETIALEDNIVVWNGGNLTFRNITLQVDTASANLIEVQSGGKMFVYDLDNDKSTTNDRSSIEKLGANNYNIFVFDGAEFEMKNSKLDGAGTNANNPGLKISADNSVIQNNEITNNYNGLTILSDNNLIEGNDFADNEYGVYIQYGLNNNISGNVINISSGGPEKIGIYAEDIFSGLLIENNVITGPGAAKKTCINFYNVNQSNITSNNITACEEGVWFQRSSNNAISNNNISDNSDVNIFLDKKKIGPNVFRSTYNLIEGNTISQSDNMGIYFFDALNNKVVNTVISDNTEGVVFQNGTKTSGANNNIIQDSIISNSGSLDILYNQQSNNNTLINTTFDISKVYVDGGNLTVKWYLNVYVNDSNGNDANNIAVTGYDKNNNLEFTENTDASGNIERQTLEEYSDIEGTKIFKTNYTITASNSSHEATTTVNLTDNKAITLTLEKKPLWIHNLSVLHSEGINRTFEFLITNQLTTDLNNVSWEFDTKDNNIITSNENIILTPGETVFVFLKYNFSASETYNVNATAINGSLDDSIDLSVTI